MSEAELYRKDAEKFCKESLHHLCKEILAWYDSGSIGNAQLFNELTRKCSLYYGIEHAKRVAEHMVKTEAMKVLAGSLRVPDA